MKKEASNMKLFVMIYLVLVMMIASNAFSSTFIQGQALIETPTSTTTSATTTTLTTNSQTNQMFTGSTTQTVVLPSATTLPVGRRFYITNRSSGIVTVNYSGGTLAKTLTANSQATFILKSNGSNAGTWDISNTIVDLTTGVVGILPVANGGTNSGASLLGNKAIVSNGSALVESATTSTEIGYLSGVTSNIQTQLNAKAPTGNYITSLTGDVTASGPGAAASTVTRINGQSLAALGTGILKNTTGTGVPSIAIAADFPTLNQNTTGTASNVTGTVAIANGGTGQTTKATAFDALSPMTTGGDIIYGGASGTGTRLANGTAGQFLKSNGTTLAPSWAAASLDTQGQSEATAVSTLTLKSPYNQLTTIGTSTRLFETGYQNLLDNADFENLVSTTSWTVGGSVVSATLNTTSVQSGKQAILLTLSGSTNTLFSQDVTPTIFMSGTNQEYGMWILNANPAVTGLQVCPRQNGVQLTNCRAVGVSASPQYYSVNIPGPASGLSVGIALNALTAQTGNVVLDNAYVGAARNLFSVNPPNTFTAKITGTASPTVIQQVPYSWVTVSRTSQGVFALTFAAGVFANNPTCFTSVENNSNSTTAQVGIIVNSNTSATTYANYNQGSASAVVATDYAYSLSCTKSGSDFTQLALAANTPSSPTIQTFTSGSGTYTKPNGVTYIKVRMVGGGGGGGGSGVAGGGTGGTGGNTTFGTSLLATNGGAGGVGTAGPGGAGGTSSLGTGPQGTALSGGSGQGASGSSGAGTAAFVGGMGASTPFAGGGAGAGFGSAGGSAVSNSGSGGGGAAGVASQNSGAGGGAGGYVEALISNPSSTYSYAVGVSGTAGTAGTSGFAGGAGGSGYIEVTEYYGAQNVPLLIGSVVSSSSGVTRTENAVLNLSGTSTVSIVSQSGSWISSATASGSLVTLNYSFTSVPSCYFTCSSSTTNVYPEFISAGPTTTSLQLACVDTASAPRLSNYIGITCTGPR